MSSTIFELRQAQASQVFTNGDYTVNLPFKTQIEEGDQIVVSKTFIDTQSETSQRITIPEGGLDLTIKGYKYFNNSGVFISDNTGISVLCEATDGNNVGTAINADSSNYVLCRELDTQQIEILENVTLRPTGNTANDYAAHGILRIEYTEVDDTAGVYESTETLKPLSKAATTIINVMLPFKAGSVPTITWIPSSTSVSPNPNLAIIINRHTQEFNAVRPLEPITYTFTANLPGGSYSEQELVTSLNDLFQTNTVDFPDYISGQQTAFFDLFPRYDQTGGDALFLVKTDGSEVARIAPNQNMNNNPPTKVWIGAAQVALDYIPTTSQFVWTYLHTPYYYNAQETVGVTGDYSTENSQPAPGDNFHGVSKTGGFFITSLDAKDSLGNSVPFWTNDLGFCLADNDSKGAKSLYLRPNVYRAVVQSDTYLVPEFTSTDTTSLPTDGVNMTTGYQAMASAIDTGSPSNQNYLWWGTPAVPFFNPVGGTTKILGSQKGVLGQQSNAGYFLLEVNGGFMNHMYDTENDHQFTKAIISRYYSQDSYTSGTTGDSLVYVHKGPANLIQSFRIRILNPDRIVPDNLGTGSAVFVELIKAQQPALPAPAPSRK